MEISTEISKVFGEEMARLFSSTITEDEILRAAKAAWQDLNEKDRWENETHIQKAVKSVLLKRIAEAAKTLLDTEEGKCDVQATAKRIVEQIRAKAEEKIIENVSDRVASISTGYGGYGLESMIAQVVHSMLSNGNR